MNQSSGNIQAAPVIVGIDYSDTAERALEATLTEHASRTGAGLHLVTIAEGASGLPSPLDTAAREAFAREARDTLRAYVDEISARLGVDASAAELHVEFGDPATQLLDRARSVGARLIVLGAHGKRGLRDLVLGSTAAHVLRRAGCSVMVVKQPRATQ